MSGFVAACGVDEVPPGRSRRVLLDGLAVAIFNDGGTIRAILDRCPHAGASLADGWIEDGQAVCPLHRWRFRLDSGRCTTGGPGVHAFRCEVRDGLIYVSP